MDLLTVTYAFLVFTLGSFCVLVGGVWVCVSLKAKHKFKRSEPATKSENGLDVEQVNK